MGRLTCGSASRSIDVDDVLLSHLHTVFVTKLRRNEGFAINWTDRDGVDRSLWMSQHSSVEWEWETPRTAPTDMALLDRLVQMASTSSGLDLAAAARLRQPPVDV